MTVDVEHVPSRLTIGLSAGAGIVALTPAVLAGRGIAVGCVGIFAILVGLRRSSRRAIYAGALGLYAAIILAGVAGARPLTLVTGTVGAVVAWDTAENGLEMVRQLSRGAEPRRTEFIHALATTAVVVIVSVGSYLVYTTVTAPRPTVVVVVLLAGGVTLLVALGRWR